MLRAVVSVLLCALSGLACARSVEPIDLETAGATLKGTLTLPDRPAKPPVVLLIAGSGPTDRDGNSILVSGHNDSLRLLAEALADQGVASVRYDKRGVGASLPAESQPEFELRFEYYVQDAAAWVQKLSQNRRFSRVVIAGHSEGSLLGMLAAQQYPQVALISIAGPSEPAAALLRRQLAGLLPADLAADSERILTELEAGRAVEQVPQQLNSLYRPSVQPYLIGWFKYDPKVELAKLHSPCLIVQGSSDMQVRVDEAQGLAAARKDCRLQVINSMNHVLKRVSTDPVKQRASYSDPTLPVVPELPRLIARFVKQKQP